MKIAIAANFDKKIAIDSKGGSEVFTYLQANELAKRDDVEKLFVFGVGEDYFHNSKIKFISLLPHETRPFVTQSPLLEKLVGSRPDAYSQIEGSLGIRLYSLIQPYLDEIDIFQNNSTSAVFNSIISLISKPFITTLHTNGDSPSVLIPYSLGFLDNLNRNYFIRIADHQNNYLKKNNVHLNILRTIYNGIDTALYPLRDDTPNNESGYWLGRISRKHNKGIKEAIQATNQSHNKLFCSVMLDDKDYYQNDILPLVSTNITIDDEITFSEKVAQYQRSSYFLFPIMWEEPFGLVLTEAMSCGTPVIAFARGAVPEIIKDGETGFIVNSSPSDIRGDWIVKKTGIDGLCEAINQITSMPPKEYKKMRLACRNNVVQNFTIQHMVDQYLEVYKQIIKS